MGLEKLNVYVTTDGNIFESLEEAKNNQEKIDKEIKENVLRQKFTNSISSLASKYSSINKNFNTINGVLVGELTHYEMLEKMLLTDPKNGSLFLRDVVNILRALSSGRELPTKEGEIFVKG
jgi:hypothetical protein